MSITILRLGHRKERDKRISTHCGLVARAFGCKKIIYSGESDLQLLESIRKICEKWGGPFKAEYAANFKKIIRNFKGTKVHLTMYGEEYEEKIPLLKKSKNLLIIIGAEKVPPEVYQLSDYNIAVGNQPHSEVAALAVVLSNLQKPKKLYAGAKIRVFPSARGKNIKRLTN